MSILEVKDLVIEFKTDRGVIRAVDGLSFSVETGETLGIVGESGCGKTVTSLAIMGLLQAPAGRIVSGSVKLLGEELTKMNPSQWRRVRGRKVAMVFQDPMTALNPVYTIGYQLDRVLSRHRSMLRHERDARIQTCLEKVGIADVRRRLDRFPHEFSGGMRQRVMIAMALLCEPSLLIADEPTTALDVTTQAQVLEQFRALQNEHGMAMMLVTHDMGVIAEVAQQVMVMYCGKGVEYAAASQIFSRARHPYTVGLLQSIPTIREQKLDKLPTIPGTVPDLLQLPLGCRFADRCQKVADACRKGDIPLMGEARHRFACVNA